MPKAKLIHIGTFDKPVGLKGEIKIKTYISKLESFTHYGPLFSDENLETWDLKLIKVITAKQMLDATKENLPVDIAVCTAAVVATSSVCTPVGPMSVVPAKDVCVQFRFLRIALILFERMVIIYWQTA